MSGSNPFSFMWAPHREELLRGDVAVEPVVNHF